MKEFTYAQSGVDRGERRNAKKFGLLEGTLPHGTIHAPYNLLLPHPFIKNKYYSMVADGVGTKVFFAQLANKHDTIGIDGVAMVVNDVIRCGAKPEALVDVIDVRKSEKKLLAELMKGVYEGAKQAGCAVAGGETADLGQMISGVGENPYHMNCTCLALVDKKNLVLGNEIEEGNVVIGLQSSGLHSNGISLARKILFSQWGGYYNSKDPVPGLKKPLIMEVLTPTRIYVKPVLEVMSKIKVKGAANITGDAYLKFGKLCDASGVGFHLHNFKPQKIFSLIQETAKLLGGKITDEEMFKTFNMGWGFALAVKEKDAGKALAVFKKYGTGAEVIGEVTGRKGEIICEHEGKRIELKG
jgi:phosphoribosylformylglycinamidine cyclo-ligase